MSISSLLRTRMPSVVPTVVSLLAVALLLVAGGQAYLVCLLTVLSLLIPVPGGLLGAKADFGPTVLGDYAVARALAWVVAVAWAGVELLIAIYSNTFIGVELNWLGIAGALALGLAVVLEPTIARLWRVPAFAANVTGWDDPRPRDALADALFWGDTIVLILMLLLAPFGSLGLLATLLGFPALIYAGWLLYTVRRFGARKRAFEKYLPKFMKELKPAFGLHWQAPAGTAYQAKMWLPYLDRLGVPYFVLVRTTTNLEDVRKVSKAPVILRQGLDELDPVIADSLKVMFYVNTSTRNDHVLRYTQLTHVQLNHGDSDKAPSYNPVFRAFDKNFVAGQAAIDRFEANGVWMPQQMFTIVGRPQVEDVQRAKAPIGDIAAPVVLYAPTWSGFYADADYSSLPAGPQIVRTLLDRGCSIVFRPHPYARRKPANVKACEEIFAMLEADAASSGREHVWGPKAEEEWSVFDCFNASDALISDVSSVVGDYLFSEKPVAMAAVTAKVADFAAEFPVAKATYIIDCYKQKLTGLEAILDDMLGADSMLPTRKQLKTYYLGDIPSENYADRFLDEARKLLG